MRVLDRTPSTASTSHPFTLSSLLARCAPVPCACSSSFPVFGLLDHTTMLLVTSYSLGLVVWLGQAGWVGAACTDRAILVESCPKFFMFKMEFFSTTFQRDSFLKGNGGQLHQLTNLYLNCKTCIQHSPRRADGQSYYYINII